MRRSYYFYVRRGPNDGEGLSSAKASTPKNGRPSLNNEGEKGRGKKEGGRPVRKKALRSVRLGGSLLFSCLDNKKGVVAKRKGKRSRKEKGRKSGGVSGGLEG